MRVVTGGAFQATFALIKTGRSLQAQGLEAGQFVVILMNHAWRNEVDPPVASAAFVNLASGSGTFRTQWHGQFL